MLLYTGKAIPLQTLTGTEGSRSLWLPDFKQSAHEGGKVSAIRTGRVYPRKCYWC
jgi:hypothetical protein